MRHLPFRILLLLTGGLLGALPVTLNAATWKTVYVADASDPKIAGEKAGALPIFQMPFPSASGKTTPVFHGSPLIFRLSGISPKAEYKVRAGFISESRRTLRLLTSENFIETNLVLEPGKAVVREWPLGKPASADGILSLAFMPAEGANAVVSKLEILSDNPAPLRREAVVEKTSDKVDPDRLAALVTPSPRISPRPESVAGVAAPVQSLDGSWRFSPEGEAVAVSPEIKVPGEWAMQGFKVPVGGEAEYLRTFDVPADWTGKVVRLRFDAVHAVCSVTVNGVAVGGHEGGFVPFELDVTRAIRTGVKNEIRVRVRCESVADSIACMSQYAAHQVGGIVRKVTLFALPPVNLASRVVTTNFDPQFRDAMMEIAVGVNNAGTVPAGAKLDFQLTDASGKTVATLADNPVLPVPPGVTKETVVRIPVLAPAKWTNESPALYTLRTTLRSEAGEVVARNKVGFRKVEVKGTSLLVNGVPVKLLGACRHEVHPLTGRSLSPELCREDARLFREGNCNFVRTSHYPPSEEFLDACDELGLFVECEAAITWIEHGASPVWRVWSYLDPKYFPYLLRANLDNLAANREHPSVVLWSIANESRWSPLFAKVDNIVRLTDPSRPTTFHDQHWGSYNNAESKASVAVYHYPSEANPDLWSSTGRPMYFGEYAHVQCYNRRELATDPFVRADWGRPLARMVALMRAQPGCLGGAIWSGVDDVFRLPDGELVGYGEWGVIDGWRRKKPEWYGMQKAYAPVAFTRVASLGEKTLRLRVDNRYAFTALDEVRWEHAGKKGAVRVAIPPGSSGEITLPVDSGVPAETIGLAVSRAGGGPELRDTLALPDALAAVEKTPGNAAPENKPALAEDADAIVVTVGNGAGATRYRFAKKTGELAVTAGGKSVVSGRILPMMLPLNGSGGAAGPAGSTYTKAIEAFTPACQPESPDGFKLAGETDAKGDVLVRITDTYGDVAGTITLVFPNREARAQVKINYDFTVKKAVDPRQWGLVLTLPRDHDTLTWHGASRDGAFDAHDIGRPSGTARANAVSRAEAESSDKNLTGTIWAEDANELGSNDFRSTKSGVDRVSLENSEPASALWVFPGKSVATRAWVEGDSIRLLVAGFNTGGSDGFFQTHYSGERRPLKSGDTVKGGFDLAVGVR